MFNSVAKQFSELWRKEDKIHVCTLFVTVLFGIAVRLVFLFQPIRYDEAFSFTYYASKPLALGLSDYSFPNNHLFHTLLVHLAYSLLGNQPWVIRLPAFIAGILLVPAGYLAARTFYDKHAALLAATMIASSSPLIEYSTNGRGYTLICLIFMVILAVGASLVHEDKPARWLLWSALAAVGFYTIPIMLYPFGIAVVWLYLSIICENPPSRRSSLIRSLFVALAAVGLFTFTLYAPVFMSSGLGAVVANRFVAPKSWDDYTGQFPLSLHSVWSQWNRDVPAGVSLVLVLGFVASLVLHKRLNRYRVPLIVAIVVWLVPVLLVQRVVPFERVWLFLLPLYFAIASAGLIYSFSLFESKKVRASALVPAVSVALSLWLGLKVVSSQSVYYSDETGTLRDAQEITVFFQGYLKAGDRVLAGVPSDAPLIYYFDSYGVSREYLRSDLSLSQRVLIVVNESSHQTIGEFLHRVKFGLAEFSSPRVIRRYQSATLYEMNRASRPGWEPSSEGRG